MPVTRPKTAPWLSDSFTLIPKKQDLQDVAAGHGFQEMFNNALDHSECTEIIVGIHKTAAYPDIFIIDNGAGIFQKIQSAMNLLDERHAVLEFSKGELTTNPDHHSGEGICFSSRMFDECSMLSGGVYFAHRFNRTEDWILDSRTSAPGTAVSMRISNHASRTAKEVFDKFVSGSDFSFSKPIVPVQLAKYGNDRLVSRSQARRLLSRMDLFKVVISDFESVPSIGQAFGDEIFRVFAKQHPEIEILVNSANPEVKKMIGRATGRPVSDASDLENVSVPLHNEDQTKT